MGNCLNKKTVSASSSSPPPSKITSETEPQKKIAGEEESVSVLVKEETTSHEIEEEIVESTIKSPVNENGVTGGGVRSSSCTKEELDAILIQCGRLSRSSSIKKSGGGSKRSYDFDKEEDVEGASKEREKRRNCPRRRTPSREREQRSGSRERRLSKSPIRRSESPLTNSTSNANSLRPGKMVSVPATVSSSSLAKPRTQSPLPLHENQNVKEQTLSTVSRRSSRKALSEIDTNIISKAPEVQNNSKVTNVGLNLISSEHENQKPHKHTRNRSSRLSRDNIDSETISLLLEDIQNFHQKKNNNTSPDISDSNKQKNKNIADTKEIKDENKNKNNNSTSAVLESEIVTNDDLMEPSLHKYITPIRTEEEEESSCSNSFAEATFSSKSEFGKRLLAKKRDCDNRLKGIGRGRIESRGTKTAPSAAI